jgi:dipeptidyl-peptidase 4
LSPFCKLHRDWGRSESNHLELLLDIDNIATRIPSLPHREKSMQRNSLVAFLSALLITSAPAQNIDSTLLSVDRIFASREFGSSRPAHNRWVENGAGYTTLEPADSTGGAVDIVRYDTDTGHRTVQIPARYLIPRGAKTALIVEDYEWSGDGTRLLLFTNSARVWRTNTRGDYWVLNVRDSSLVQLGGGASPSTLMFAKFSPDGSRVGYVRENNLYVENLFDGKITQLTRDGSRTTINGTFDWVYEEEFSCRDGFSWSPDGNSIAFWQLDASGVRDFLMVNTTDSLYSFVIPVQYPKVGEKLSACRIGVVAAKGGPTMWFRVDGDSRNTYIPRMVWAPGSTEILFQHLNRLQDTMKVMLGDVRTGSVRTLLTETDSTWIEVVDDFQWMDGGNRFTWVSEVDGWNHVWIVGRDGTRRLVTTGGYDVVKIENIDESSGWIYFMASPENPTQRYLYRTRLDGEGKAYRLSPAAQAGTHSYIIAPGAKYAFHTFSSFGTPPATEIIRLPGHEVLRRLTNNDALKSRLQTLKRGSTDFFRVDIGNGVVLDGWRMLPPDFDSTKKYPVLVNVYGEPASQTVVDRWGGSGMLWHLMLTQKGYIVLSVDNRGTPAPRGREWRKVVYKKIGILASYEQAAAIKEIRKWPFVDSTRIGVWGWSGGGSMTLNLMFRHPDLYQTGMSVAPVSDQHLYDAIYQERYMGLPSIDDRPFKEGSPVTYAAGLKGNLLIVHGTGDDNVHYQNTERVVNALIAANKQFTMMAYPNRSHGIYEGRGTTRHLYTLLTRYLTEHLPPGGR